MVRPVASSCNIITVNGPEFSAFVDGRTGFSFPEGDVDQFVKVVDKLLLDDNLRRNMAEEVLDIPRSKYNTRVMADRFAKVVWAAVSRDQIAKFS